jgi:hypothetical protein
MCSRAAIFFFLGFRSVFVLFYRECHVFSNYYHEGSIFLLLLLFMFVDLIPFMFVDLIPFRRTEMNI